MLTCAAEWIHVDTESNRLKLGLVSYHAGKIAACLRLAHHTTSIVVAAPNPIQARIAILQAVHRERLTALDRARGSRRISPPVTSLYFTAVPRRQHHNTTRSMQECLNCLPAHLVQHRLRDVVVENLRRSVAVAILGGDVRAHHDQDTRTVCVAEVARLRRKSTTFKVTRRSTSASAAASWYPIVMRDVSTTANFFVGLQVVLYTRKYIGQFCIVYKYRRRTVPEQTNE